MKQCYIQKQNASRLTVFFAGWGMDVAPFTDYTPVGSDLMLCYDYRTLDFVLPEGYREIRVVGWSMGVWAASQVLQSVKMPITESIALNGTMTPVNDEKGISKAIFQGTLNGLNERNLQKFYRRMCLPRKGLDGFIAIRLQRDVEDLKEELRIIGEQSVVLPVSSFIWNKAVIGKQDLIFTSDRQWNAWKDSATEVEELDIPHYSEEIVRRIVCGEGVGI